MRLLLALLAAAAPLCALDVDRDTRLPPGEHGPLRVVADGVTLDLEGAVVAGAEASPDAMEGIGILVEGRKRVTIRGGRVTRFRCGILVRDCEEVTLDRVEVSGNFRQRLRSTPEREDESDWLWPHRNDGQEWRKNYGAGICLENCRKCVVRDCVGRAQQNGILLDRCGDCRVEKCDMSFLSGWGLALWRSSGNVIERNDFDWCVRGYSHGVYDRGQDSAGILVFEQCCRNRFLLNSATHSGDGFFLYAGHETLERTGQGGCNENLVERNDFSHAVANGIEATFSGGNCFTENLCDDCNYGIWAGYSYRTMISRNRVAGNRYAGIAIEHGSDTTISDNRFAGNPVAIDLWWDPDPEFAGKLYAASHHLRSEGYEISDNVFGGDKVGIRLRDTSHVAGDLNAVAGMGEFLRVEGRCEGVDVKTGERTVDAIFVQPGRFPAGKWEHRARGRAEIRIGEWGPLDPSQVEVFPRDVVAWGACAFHVLGPGEEYTVDLPEGLTAERTGRTFRVRGGGAGLLPFAGKVRTGGLEFPISGTLLNASWSVRHWKWEADPRENAAGWDSLLRTPPLDTRTVPGLDFHWKGGAPSDAVPADRFATLAETRMRLPAGRYDLRAVSDDGVRVRLDGKKVIDNWTWHGPTEDRARVEIGEGEHALVVEHFEIDGWAVLVFDLRPVTGSPGGR